MAEVNFYHFLQGSLEKSVAKLLEKIYQAGLRSVLLMESEEKQEYYNSFLWTFHPSSFLPHGSSKEGNGEHQPLWLTTHIENPNCADVLVTVDGITLQDLSSFKRCLDIFNGHDEDAVNQARQRWKFYKEAGHALTYWQQNEAGQWKKRSLDR